MQRTPYMTPEIRKKKALAQALQGIEMPRDNPVAALAAGLARGYGMGSGIEAEGMEQQAYGNWQQKLAQSLMGAQDQNGLAQALLAGGMTDPAVSLMSQGMQRNADQAQWEQRQQFTNQLPPTAYQQQTLDAKAAKAAAGASGGGTSADMQLLSAVGAAMDKQAQGGTLSAQERLLVGMGQQLLAKKGGMIETGMQIQGLGSPGVVPVPGSNVEAERTKVAESAAASNRKQSQILESMRERVQGIEAIAPGLSSSGPLRKVGQMAGEVANLEDATRLGALVEEIKATNMVEELLRMKRESPNGASGFGALNATEGEAIRATVGSLRADMPRELMLEQVRKILRYYENAAAGRYITDDTGEATPFAPKASAPAQGASGFDPDAFINNVLGGR